MTILQLNADDVLTLKNKLDAIEDLLKNQKLVMTDAILSTDQVMSYLGISRRTLQYYRDNGLISYAAINSKFFYRVSAIDTMLNNHLVRMVN